MFKKTIRRLIRIAGIFVGLLVTTICVAGFLALQEPAYYTELRKQQPTAGELAAATEQVESHRIAYLKWRSQSLADQRERLNQAEPRVGQPDGLGPIAHEVRCSDANLNTLLAAETSRLGDVTIRDPRVRVTPGRLDFACGILTPLARFVLSAELAPELLPGGVLTLDIESVRVGRVPLPCKTLAGFFPRQKVRLSGALYLDTTDPTPRLTLDLSDKANKLLAESLECTEGELTVRFVAHERVD